MTTNQTEYQPGCTQQMMIEENYEDDEGSCGAGGSQMLMNEQSDFISLQQPQFNQEDTANYEEEGENSNS